jgi:HAE1 family hydrophobic/amphiphilic exporter-1
VLTTVLLLAFVVFGVLAYFGLPVSLAPEIKLPYVTIQTVYAGASPDVIETQISKRIEDQVTSIANIEAVTSYSLDSVSVVLIEFKYGTDENLDLQEVKDKVEVIISDLPSDAERPAISKVNISTMSPVMSIVLEGDMEPTELYTFGDTVVADRLAQVSGVGSVELSGGQKREIRVELERSTVFERSVPVQQVAGLLAAANVELPGGNIQVQGQDVPVRLKGEFKNLDEVRDLDVPTGTGIFKLHQLAEVKDATTEVRERTILMDKKAGTRNENALLLKVIKNPSANTIDVVNGVNERISALEAESGGKVKLKVIKEDATFVRDSVNDTLSNIYQGILFTGLVLLIFLHDLRSTLIIALAMPFSIIATFLVMKTMGISLNILSLMGLSSSTGTLVANSVVVLENIFRYKELGHSRIESASRGTKEVLVAVFASTMTNVAVFVPLANMSGMMGAMLSNFAYTIVIATLFSILVSFTLTPLMASRLLPESAKPEGRLSIGLEKIFKSWDRAYGRTLKVILKNKRNCALVTAAVVAIFALSLALFPSLKMELMPTTDGGKIQVAVELPQGTDLNKTAKVLETIEKRISQYDEVESMLTTLGSLGSMNQDVSVAQMDVFLVPRGKRSESNSQLALDMTQELSDIPGATIRVSPLSEMSSGQTSAAIDLYLKGPDNAVLQDLSEKVKTRMSGVPGIVNAATSSKAGKLELSFEPDRKRLSEDGLTVQAIAVALRASVDGLVLTRYKEGGEEYDIRVMIKDSDLLDIESLKNVPIVSAAGTNPLSRYAKVSFADGYNKIMRTDKVRTVELTANLMPGYSQSGVLAAVMKATKDVGLPAGYSIQQAGMSEQYGKTIRELATVFVIAVLLTYMLMAAILESFTQPIIILATVPLTIIGVVAFCLPLGVTLNFIALLGIIMLVGIVVNNAILMLDYYNQLRREGKGAREAMIEACPTKLKAILMSNIAIVLGMLPMALGMGASGAEMRQPMGIVIIGGIVSSTVFTLYLIPALELLVTRRARLDAVAAKES